MHRHLSAGVRQSVHFVNSGLQISLSAGVQKSTAHNAGCGVSPQYCLLLRTGPKAKQRQKRVNATRRNQPKLVAEVRCHGGQRSFDSP